MLLNDKQKAISKLLRHNAVRMGDFTSDQDMIEWGKAFCLQVFELCTTDEKMRFHKVSPAAESYETED
jgi:hypothetical protein